MCRVAYARGAMNIHSHIARRSNERFPSMKSHADSQRLLMNPVVCGERALRIGSTLYSIQRAGKGDKEDITLSIHFASIPLLNGTAQNFMMFSQHRSVLITQCIQ